ncbi:hypothetical protein [Flavimarina sp. Hel_I_48]|uniref:hypothetical protein n=1 Tax=Flavimarina sp. Hel_I_48 TaxID=1392488 RepID=UPI0004DEED22|nr:hypothetical protein [Flavimarina sp. Hel_I_48]
MKKTTKQIDFLGRYGYVILSVIFFVLLALYNQTQDSITFNNGEGFDGVKYVDVVEQMRAGEPVAGPAPFVYRLATPYLTSLLPYSILNSYFIINSFFALISGLLLFYWLKKTLGKPLVAFGFVIYLFLHWQASLRFTVFYPADCDPLAIIFVMLGLILLQKLNEHFTWKKVMLLSALIFIGVFQREFILSIAFGIPFLGNCFKIENGQITINKALFIRNLKAFLPVFIVSLLGIWITHLLVITLENGYGFIHAIYRWMHQKSVFMLLAGFFYTLGILLIFPFLFPKSAVSVFKKHVYLVPILAIALALAWISGGDTERFILWYCPIYFLVIGQVLVDNKSFFLRKRVWIPTLISLVLTLRVFWQIPQYYLDYEGVSYPFFAVFGEDNFSDILATHATKWVTTANLILYLLLSLYFVYWRFVDKIRNMIRWQ